MGDTEYIQKLEAELKAANLQIEETRKATEMSITDLRNQLTEKDRLNHEAKEIIHDLLKGGYHEGPCDNEGMESDEACSLHLKAARDRSKKADEFLNATEKRKCVHGVEVGDGPCGLCG